MCFNNFLNMCAKTLNDGYFQTEAVFVLFYPCNKWTINGKITLVIVLLDKVEWRFVFYAPKLFLFIFLH